MRFLFQDAYKMHMARSRAQLIKCEYFWRLANHELAILPSSERKLRKNALCLNQSAFSNFALYVINDATALLGLDSRSPPKIRCVLCIVELFDLGQLCESCPLVDSGLFVSLLLLFVCLFFCYSFSISKINFQSPSNLF